MTAKAFYIRHLFCEQSRLSFKAHNLAHTLPTEANIFWFIGSLAYASWGDEFYQCKLTDIMPASGEVINLTLVTKPKH